MRNHKDQRDVIETASATTSPDNEKSGPFAYIVTGVALAILLVMSLVATSCVSMVITASQAYQFAPYESDHGNYTPDDFGYQDLEDFIRRYSQEIDSLDSVGSDSSNDQGTAELSDVLDFDLAPYHETIDAELPASSYAGTPQEVRDFVRSIVTLDRDYASEVSRLLDAAAINEDGRSDSLHEARSACEKASAEMLELQIPTVSGDEDGAVKDALGTAVDAVERRWDALEREMELLDESDGTVDTNRLWERDEDVTEATEKAATLLEEAMEAAARD